jgi:hypothetical protein
METAGRLIRLCENALAILGHSLIEEANNLLKQQDVERMPLDEVEKLQAGVTGVVQRPYAMTLDCYERVHLLHMTMLDTLIRCGQRLAPKSAVEQNADPAEADAANG